ncbi:MAG: hypothetical protein HOI07_06235 [Betaproteobacteria bacterium]|mgnify:FL=1|nr:hypothetical protein [Betaproteobacteria bacterium]
MIDQKLSQDCVALHDVSRGTVTIGRLVMLLLVLFVTLTIFPERSFGQQEPEIPEIPEVSEVPEVKKGGGLDPTKKKIFLRTEYKKLENNTSSLIGDALVELPVASQWYARVSMPFKRNTALSGGSNYGLGDLVTRISYLAINTSAGTRLFFGMENKWDTATDTALGGDKYTISPVVTGFMRFPEAKIVTFPSIQYVDTLGGSSSSDSRNTTIKGTTVKILTDGYYLMSDPAFIWDHERNDQSTGTFDLEYGRFVEGKTMYYVRPGTTLWGDSTPFSFKWNIEFGVRIFM